MEGLTLLSGGPLGSAAAAVRAAAVDVTGARFVADVTYPDHSVVNAGGNFTKTWQFKNTGTTTRTGFRLVFKAGDQLGGPASVPIATTRPNATVNISVALKAPASGFAAQFGRWEIRDQSNRPVAGGGATVVVTVSPSSGPKLGSNSYRVGGVNPLVNQGFGGQCTAYAWGRANELKGVTNLPTGAARTWLDRFPKQTTPRAHSIAVWGGTASNPNGHVAYVESVSGQNVTISEANLDSFTSYAARQDSRWGGGYDGRMKTLTVAQMQSRSGAGTLLGYIYL